MTRGVLGLLSLLAGCTCGAPPDDGMVFDTGLAPELPPEKGWRRLANWRELLGWPGTPPDIGPPTDPILGPYHPAGPGEPRKRVVVEVYYGTDRARSAGADPKRPGSYFGDDPAEKLSLGVARVSIPPLHAVSKLERPWKIWRVEGREDPERHFVLLPLDPSASEKEWVEDLSTSGASAGLVFVPGFGTGFAQAARRSAQIVYDLDFDGVPLVYSWPASGKALRAKRDRERAEAAGIHFQRFLELVTHEAGLGRVHVVAHSMGSRVVAAALAELEAAGATEPVIDQLVLAAAEIETDRFEREYQTALPLLARRSTLYLSADDRVLRMSKVSLAGARAGELDGGALGAAGWDTVDASAVHTDFWRHRYYADNVPILTDLACLVELNTPPGDRPFLYQGQGKPGEWWSMRRRKPLEPGWVTLDACRR